LGALRPPPGDREADRPAVQAAFCIDVRSEPLRRHLEARDPGIETLGFAGFFGVALRWEDGTGGSPRCPPLLDPEVRLGGGAEVGASPASGVLKEIRTAPTAGFTFAETLGFGYAAGLVADALGRLRRHRSPERDVEVELEPDGAGRGIPLETRVELAEGILLNMGFRGRFARLVLLCGHEGRSENNPHAAGLDCGACRGHSGALNARVAASIMNDDRVRDALARRGRGVPEETRFVAGVHETTTDRVTLLDADRIPAGHREEADRLRRWLQEAASGARRERADRLGLEGTGDPELLGALRRRARDWSEVRPEWALARNAAFIAARRSRTRQVDLDGRAFLHRYDWRGDPDGSVLELILSAPVVVAAWINLQYLASTVDNDFFGAGSKALQDRVGDRGVVLGNGSDLRTGLALQSVHGPDGEWFHEPLRLQVVVEAPRERIDGVLAEAREVRELVENGWIRLFALDPEGEEVALRGATGEWEEVVAAPATTAGR